MAFNNLKTKRIREVTGKQLAGVSNVFVDTTSKSDFREISDIKGSIVNGVTFTGGLPYPDGIKLAAQEANNAAKYFYPETFFPNEVDSDSYLLQLMAISVTVGGGDTGTIAPFLEDGNETLVLYKPTSVTASAPFTFEPTNPIFINKNCYLTIQNAASVDANITVAVALVARGGNPQ